MSEGGDGSALRPLPPGWAWATLADIVESSAPIMYGILQPGPETENGVPYVRPTEIVDGEIRLDSVRRTSHAIAEQYKRSSLKPNDVLLSIVGTVGKVATVPPSLAGANITQSSVRVRADSQVMQPSFVAMQLQCSSLLRQFSEKMLGTGVPRLNVGDVRALVVAVPPLGEQRRVVAKLDELLAASRRAREALDAVPAMLDQYRRSVLASALRGDLTSEWRLVHPAAQPPETAHARRKPRGRSAIGIEQDAFENQLPSSWRLVLLQQVATLQPGYAFRSSDFSVSGVRLLRGINIEPGGTRWTQCVYLPTEKAASYAAYELAPGDVVIAMDRPLISTGIKVAVITPNDLPALLLQRVGRFLVDGHLDRNYLRLYLNSDLFVSRISDAATGTQLPHVSASDVESSPLPLPPLAEQKEIVRLVEAAFARIEAVRAHVAQQRAQLDALDRAILDKAFRGELVPQDPNDEPASVMLERLRAERAAKGDAKRPRGRGSAARPSRT